MELSTHHLLKKDAVHKQYDAPLETKLARTVNSPGSVTYTLQGEGHTLCNMLVESMVAQTSFTAYTIRHPHNSHVEVRVDSDDPDRSMLDAIALLENQLLQLQSSIGATS